ncbi:MAG: hypothetical protein MUC89_19900 [Acetobacteraceae bacterium]|jgi:hypothetical protein|nr:hypothetical protein [Acetobacteraceae bacterium]
MTGIPAIAPAMRPAETPPRAAPAERAAPAAPAVRAALAGPPLGRDEIEPMPAEVTFGEFVRALNPLHHIPVVGWIYRQVTGETIQPVFRVLGGLVTGGPIGAIASAVGALAEELMGKAEAGSGTAVAEAPAAAPVPAAAATATAATAAPQPGSLAAIVTASGQPLQPLPLATRLAARAYPTPALPMREAAPPPDPAAGFVPAAAPLPAPARAAERVETAGESVTAAPAPADVSQPGPQARVRRAPVVPVTSGGQDPAFMQQMMRGLEAYERAMRARTGATPQPIPAAAAP